MSKYPPAHHAHDAQVRLLEDVTIIIPEHNRPERLQRLLNYYAGSGAKILVPDSSAKMYMGTYDTSTTQYFYTPGANLLAKLRDMLKLISTPYVIWVADDDFAVPTGIAKVVRFLDENPDYVVAQGHYLTFESLSDGSVKFEPRYIRNFESRVDGGTPVERLVDRSGQYASFLYGLLRTEVFIKMYSHCYNSKGEPRFTNLYLAEEFFNNATRIYGKYATVPCFFSARERISGSAASITMAKSVVMKDPAMCHEYDGYIGALTDVLLEGESSLTREQAEDVIRSVDRLPNASKQIALKRRIITFCDHNILMRPLKRLFEYRYVQKGMRAVKGMSSYPCNELTPEIKDILKALKAM